MLNIRLNYISFIANRKTTQVVKYIFFAKMMLFVVGYRQNALKHFAAGDIERIYTVSSNIIQQAVNYNE